MIALYFAVLFGVFDSIERYYSPERDKTEVITPTEKTAKDTREHGDSTSQKNTSEIIDSLERMKREISLKPDSLKKRIYNQRKVH